MPVKQNEQAAGNGGGDAVSAEDLNIPLSEIVIDAQIRSEFDIEDESFQSLKVSIQGHCQEKYATNFSELLCRIPRGSPRG